MHLLIGRYEREQGQRRNGLYLHVVQGDLFGEDRDGPPVVGAVWQRGCAALGHGHRPSARPGSGSLVTFLFVAAGFGHLEVGFLGEERVKLLKIGDLFIWRFVYLFM